MGYDKLVDSAQLDADLMSVADAIREKSGTSAALAFPAGFVSEVEAIETGGSNPLTELAEIHVSSDVRSVAVTPDNSWFDYDFLIIRYDISLTGSDWIYASKTNTNTSGGIYSANSITSYKYVSSATKVGSSIEVLFPAFINNGRCITVASGETLYLYTYTASKAIASGSSITIYGGTKDDL